MSARRSVRGLATGTAGAWSRCSHGNKLGSARSRYRVLQAIVNDSVRNRDRYVAHFVFHLNIKKTVKPKSIFQDEPRV
ncbi:hypothetical protein J6590_041388 [Homalodisca vitripennis]|nr:hypothetical protein J6590_041388 [Homalodisca vitripennis]